MIEQGIYFALGCIVTALFSLAFAPLFWRRALRLTRRRLQLQVPLSMQEILADRDGLRAEFAVEQLRIEQAMEQVRATKGEDMAAIGRHSAAAATSAAEVAELRVREIAREAEIARLSRDLEERGAESGTLKIAINDAHARIERWRREYDLSEAERHRLEAERHRLEAEHHRLEDEVVEHRTTIASLETRAMGLEMRLTDAQRGYSSREQSLADSMRNRLESAVAQAQRHEVSGLSLRRELDEARARVRALEEGAATPADETDDAGLRASIHALGLAVATMTRAVRLDHQHHDALGESPARRASDPAPVEAS